MILIKKNLTDDIENVINCIYTKEHKEDLLDSSLMFLEISLLVVQCYKRLPIGMVVLGTFMISLIMIVFRNIMLNKIDKELRRKVGESGIKEIDEVICECTEKINSLRWQDFSERDKLNRYEFLFVKNEQILANQYRCLAIRCLRYSAITIMSLIVLKYFNYSSLSRIIYLITITTVIIMITKLMTVVSKNYMMGKIILYIIRRVED